MNIIIYTLVILTIFYLLLKKFSTISSKKISKSMRIMLIIGLFLLAIFFAIAGRFLLTLPLTLASLALLKLKGLSIFQLISLYRLIQTLRRSGRFSFNNSSFNNVSSISVSEAYKILNLDKKKKITKEDVNKAYIKIQKKIHPDISPETSRLSSIVNEAKDIVLKIDKRYFRPSEVDSLLGNPVKAKNKLNWEPSTNLNELVREMIQHDKKLISN